MNREKLVILLSFIERTLGKLFWFYFAAGAAIAILRCHAPATIVNLMCVRESLWMVLPFSAIVLTWYLTSMKGVKLDELGNRFKRRELSFVRWIWEAVTPIGTIVFGAVGMGYAASGFISKLVY